MAGEKSQKSNNDRSWDEAVRIHRLLRRPLARLFKCGAFDLKKGGKPEVFWALCKATAPIKRGEIKERTELEDNDASNALRGLSKGNIFECLKDNWKDWLPIVDMQVVIAKLGRGKNTRRYFDIPGMGPDVIKEKRRQLNRMLQESQYIPDPGELRPLTHIENVLSYGEKDTSSFFRPTGPLEVDFRDGCVHRRGKWLDRLKRELKKGGFCILQGASASGKSVLARQLAYELYESIEYIDVWFLERTMSQQLSKGIPIGKIENANGMVIIEDGHLIPDQLEDLYSSTSSHEVPPVLIVTRNSIWRSLNENFSKLAEEKKQEVIHLPEFEVAEEIIKLFKSKCDEEDQKLPWTQQDMDDLEKVSEKSYWLLAYALKGYAKQGGAGKKSEWIGTEVQEDLAELEKINHEYPEILVALSPLYMHEVPTAVDFLFNKEGLGFHKQPIVNLHQWGEIIRLEKDEKIYYGLPHSSLSDVYWKYGERYRNELNLPNTVKDFVYEYAAAGMPNGCSAVTYLKIKDRKAIMQSLKEKRKLVDAVQAEKGTHVFALFAEDWARYIPEVDGLGKALAHRLEKIENPRAISKFFRDIYKLDVRVSKELCKYIDARVLAGKVEKTTHLAVVGELICTLHKVNKETGKELWNYIMDIGALARRVENIASLREVSTLVWRVHGANEDVGRELCDYIDAEPLAGRIEGTNDFESSSELIWWIHHANREAGRELCEYIDVKVLAGRIEKNPTCRGVGELIQWINKANEKKGRELVAAFSLDKLGKKEIKTKEIRRMTPLIKALANL